jgi:hypothetical protein
MNPDHVMEHPARCGVLPRWALLMRKRGVWLLEGGAKTILQRGIYQQAHRHDHQPRHDAFRLFESARGGQKLRVFAEATPACGRPWACVAFHEPRGRSPDGIEGRGRQEEATVLVDPGLTRGQP